MPEKPHNFWQELKRRKVFRVITVYAAAAFVILELIDIVTEPFGLPEWTLRFVFILLCVGFVLAVILSWVYDITPEGVQKTKPLREVEKFIKSTSSNIWKIISYVSIIVIIGLVIVNIVSRRNNVKEFAGLEKSIAVLPFENWNSDEEYAYLGDAIANEINTQLAKIQEFHVFSYTSSSLYKGSNKPSMPQIGSEIGANFIIEGTVERQDEDVSIHVQVIQADNDNHIWAHEFKEPWKDIFKIRAQIAVRIADELKAILSTEEIENIEKNPTENIEAYNLYLKSRYYWNQRTDTSLMKALDYCNEALKLDPSYALAYSGLADCYSFLIWYDPPAEDEYEKAEVAALKALDLDNSLGEAHASLGLIKIMMWDWSDAEDAFRTAIELNPRNSLIHTWYALLLKCIGNDDIAIQEIQEAFNLDPLSWIVYSNLSQIYISIHDYDKAIETLEEASQLFVEYDASSYLGRAYLNKEMYEKALRIFKESNNKIWTGITYAKMGQSSEATQILSEILEDSKTKYISPFHLSILYFSLGLNDEGFSSLQKGYEIQDLQMTEIKSYPILDEIKFDNRFRDQLRKMGLKVD